VLVADPVQLLLLLYWSDAEPPLSRAADGRSVGALWF
jgi:hypothetical protein